jgi:outer membrane protein assembly factor BamB
LDPLARTLRQGLVAGTGYVDTWSDTTNVMWRAEVPGRGHSSPIVWKDWIFLTTARDGGAKLSMLAYRRRDGRLLWETSVPSSGVERIYDKNSHASATPTTDGQRVYASFGTHGVAAFEFDGRLAWHKKLGEVSNYHGTAGSPVLYKDRLFLYQDHDGSAALRSFVAAFDTRSGNVIWKTDRVESVGWGTPVVINAGDRDELIVSSQRRVYAYDPNSGAELWTVRGNLFEVIPTPGRRPRPRLLFVGARRSDARDPAGRPRRRHRHPRRLDLAARIAVRALVDHSRRPALHDQRHAEHPHGRRGAHRRAGVSGASWPGDARRLLVVAIAVGDTIFFTNDLGQTFVVQAGRTFKLLRVNELNAQVLASPALVDSTWYWRTDRALLAIGR